MIAAPRAVAHRAMRNDSTLYSYVQIAKSLIVQIRVTKVAKESPYSLNNNTGRHFMVLEGRTGLEVRNRVLSRFLSPGLRGSCPIELGLGA